MTHNFQVIQKDVENRILTCSTSLSEAQLHSEMESNMGCLCGCHGQVCEAGTVISKEFSRALGIPVGDTFVKFRFNENDWNKVKNIKIGDKMKDTLCSRKSEIQKDETGYSEADRLSEELVNDVNDPKKLTELLKTPEGKKYYNSIEKIRLAERAKNLSVE